MSYPKDLDEYSAKEIQAELDRRERCRNGGRCDYCDRPLGSKPACAQATRHKGKA